MLIEGRRPWRSSWARRLPVRDVENWAKLPAGWSFKEVAAVGVDSNDNVYVFNRGEHPMMVFDRDGNFLRSWGEGLYPARARRAHGPGRHDLADRRRRPFRAPMHARRQGAAELGIPGKPAPYMSGEPFHRCTHTALSPQGDIYVSDGYGNARVHKYSPDGKLLMSWGEPGTDPGQFNIVHNICMRRRRLGLCRRPREPPRPGVRRQRQVRDAVEQPAPAVRPLHGRTRTARSAISASWARDARSTATSQSRPARQHRRQHRASCWRGSATRMPARRRPRSSRRTASPSTRAATSMSARCRWTLWPGCSRASRGPANLRALQKYERVQ